MRREHVVVIKFAVDMPHCEVLSRVLKAVVDVFEDRGPVEVSGIDWEKREAEMKKLREERDDYRAAWLKEREAYREATSGDEDA